MRDRSHIWIGIADMMLATVAVVMVAVAPHSKAKGPEDQAFFIVSADWPLIYNSDADLHMRTPSGAHVNFQTRAADCVSLDRDSRGFVDSRIKLADGSEVAATSYKESMKVACLVPGTYDVAVNLFAYHGKMVEGHYVEATYDDDVRGFALPVHVEVLRINPALKIEYSGDILLQHGRQTVNVVSFELAADGALKLVDPPVTPIDEDR